MNYKHLKDKLLILLRNKSSAIHNMHLQLNILALQTRELATEKHYTELV